MFVEQPLDTVTRCVDDLPPLLIILRKVAIDQMTDRELVGAEPM